MASGGSIVSGRAGAFVGHFIPGAFFFAFGAFCLILSLRRLVGIAAESGRFGDDRNGVSQTFCQRHVPERDVRVLRRISIAIAIATTVGFVVEGGSGHWVGNNVRGLYK